MKLHSSEKMGGGDLAPSVSFLRLSAASPSESDSLRLNGATGHAQNIRGGRVIFPIFGQGRGSESNLS